MRVVALVAVAGVGCGFSGHLPGSGSDAPTTTDARAAGVDAPPGSADAAIDAPPNSADARTEFLIEAEDYDTITTSPQNHQWMIRTDEPGYSAASFLQLLPGNGSACTDPTQLATCAAKLGYDVPIAITGTYYVHVRSLTKANDEDSVWLGVDGVPVTTPIEMDEDSTWNWDTGGVFALPAGIHTIDLWQREAGVRIDALFVTPSFDTAVVTAQSWWALQGLNLRLGPCEDPTLPLS